MNIDSPQDPSALERGQPWQKTLYIMFAAQLLSIIGFAFVLPFLPFYIRELGVTDARLVPVWAGVRAASAEAFPLATLAVAAAAAAALAGRRARR